MPADDPAVGGASGRSAAMSRRAVLRTVGVAATWGALTCLLGGCDIRIQDDAPDLPLLQRKSIPDEAALIRAVRSVTDLGQQAGRIPNPSAEVTGLAGEHLTQASVLRGRLTSAGVPNHVIDPAAPSAPGTDGPSVAVSAPPAATPQQLAAGEGAALLSLLTDLRSVTEANRVVLVAVAVACGAAADELATPVTWPTSHPLPATAAAQLLDETRSARWAFQVVAAQSTGDARAAALAAEATLAARAADLTTMAGTSATAAPLGYALPYPVTTPEAAARLGPDVLTRLVASGLGPVPLVPSGSSALSTLIRLQVSSVGLARQWGVTPGPFPGMTYP